MLYRTPTLRDEGLMPAMVFISIGYDGKGESVLGGWGIKISYLFQELFFLHVVDCVFGEVYALEIISLV
jgi:hypothetical protein